MYIPGEGVAKYKMHVLSSSFLIRTGKKKWLVSRGRYVTLRCFMLGQ
jgi:hypothetical protein